MSHPDLWERLVGRPDQDAPGRLWPRWLLLRALGLIFLSAFYSLARQIDGLIGARGILPADQYLDGVREALHGATRFWVAPSVFWMSASDRALTIVVVLGLVASVLLLLNVWPRAMIAICTILFLSCVSVLQDFSSYQSDGMLLEFGTLALFLAPAGLRPGLGADQPPSRAAVFLLQWEWFRIYFESGVVKLASGDPQWRHLTAMDHYYENGPLPTWIGWYVQQLPHGFHAGTALLTLVMELGMVWLLFTTRRLRLICFAVVTVFQLGIILTANYAFLNYLVLSLGVLLLDDGAFARVGRRVPRGVSVRPLARWALVTRALVLGWLFYATIVAFVGSLYESPLGIPARLLAPFRIANAYGLFAVMTTERYEIEFQGSRDGVTWTPYRFRYKPQDPLERPGIYAPYQPRFDWNLWFASLGPWRQTPWVAVVQLRLIEGSPSVLHLFLEDPFRGTPPPQVRAVLWRYWFTDLATKRATGRWWNREFLGLFSGTLIRQPNGALSMPDAR